MRSGIIYVLAYLPVLILSLLFIYFSYKWRVKRYKKIFLKSLIKNGVPRKIAKTLSEEIKIIKVRDLLTFDSMKNIL